MPIVCLEGPNAVGKSSTAAALVEGWGASVVPEVHVLFDRPADEPANWYLARQVDRWRLAMENAAGGRLVVLDGDPFQPLWYNSAYGASAGPATGGVPGGVSRSTSASSSHSGGTSMPWRWSIRGGSDSWRHTG